MPTAPAPGCEHVPLDVILPRIGSDIPENPYRRAHYRNDQQLIPGQQVPEFTLADLAGHKVSLATVLDANDTVLIDFWKLSCGPCIASFPKLAELRAQYQQQGFEIVTISMDPIRDDWVNGSAEHELPWVNLGELESFNGEVAVSYGVRFIPKNYLVDTNGCLLHKDLTAELLATVLAERYN